MRSVSLITLGLTVALAASTLVGCGETTRSTRTDRSSGVRPTDQLLGRPVARPLSLTAANQVSAEVQPRGTVPYDNDGIPMVSPGGEFIATQTGLPPNPSVHFAEDGAQLELTSRIDIYRVDATSNQPPMLVASVEESALLGRSGDDRGFLIESPRPDGSRWIGRAAWHDGTVEWLVTGPHVNAFADLGPDGRLAWSRRVIGSDRWALVVRDHLGEREHARDGDWIMPTFSGEGCRLFVMLLRESRAQDESGSALDLLFFDAADFTRMRGTMRSQPLTRSGASVATVVNAMTVPTHVRGTRSPQQPEHLSFYDPRRHRPGAAIWYPTGNYVHFGPDSWAAVLDNLDPDYVLVTTRDAIERRHIRHQAVKGEIMAGMQIARPTGDPDRPWILLRPDQGRLDVTVMRLLPPSEAPLG